MDNFDKIIKQKAEQFEVPFNEAHWAEMDGRLNSIRATKVKNTILGSAAAIVVLAVSSYFILSNDEVTSVRNNEIVATNSSSEIIIDNNAPIIEQLKSTPTNAEEKNTAATTINTIENNIELSIEEKNKVLVKENNLVIENQEITKGTENTVVNNLKVNPDFIVYNNKVCLGEAVSFESLHTTLPVSYTWNFGDGTISHKTNPTHKYKDSHVYSVSLTLLNRETGKEFTSIQEDIVMILPSPKTDFSYEEMALEHDDNKLTFPYTKFKAKDIDKENTYRWNFGNGKTSTSTTAKTIYKEKEKSYSATLIIENSFGCINSSTIKVFNKNGMDLFAQTGFKPHSTIEENKTFMPGALLGWEVKFEMTILNKSGKTIYITSDKNEPWNGRLNNSGEILNEGVYLWKITTYDSEGISHRHHGKINLVK